MNLLKVENLSVVDVRNGQRIVNNISFSLEANCCLGIVGESGSGKSMTCKALLDLTNPWIQVTGSVFFNGKELERNSSDIMRKIRGKNISMILQDPMTAFDPVFTIGYQIRETFCENLKVTKREAAKIALESLERVGIYDSRNVLEKYPHQLSGGMLQRCMIATAMGVKPEVIIADEPTTALDSINQREIVNQFHKLQHITGTALIFISHNLGVVQRLAQKVLVMKDGSLIEYGDANQIFRKPKHQYTRYLVETHLSLSNPFRQIMNRKEA